LKPVHIKKERAWEAGEEKRVGEEEKQKERKKGESDAQKESEMILRGKNVKCIKKVWTPKPGLQSLDSRVLDCVEYGGWGRE